jgi:UDP-2,4-diacetamido-2,4,6-trideoxy-beta-L-altropyranose hydrolase
MHLVVRADGGPEIGYGHLIRSNALIEEFLTLNHEVTVATTTPQPALSVYPRAVEIAELPSRGDPEPFVDWLKANQSDAVFTDSYPIDTEYQRTVRDRVPLAVLQDDDRHAVCADLFVNGNLYAPVLDYKFVGYEPRTCLGVDYVLLRSEIRERSEDDPPWREQPERALVMMGGSDIANLMPTALHAFDGFDIHVDAIIGPGFSDAQERSIRATVEGISADVSVARNPDDLVERMFQADFAVSTSSSTTYELLALGTPIVSVPVADNQVPIARSLREHDAACVLECGANREAFRRAIEAYVSSTELRRKRREVGRRLVDGQGVERVYTELLSAIENNS